MGDYDIEMLYFRYVSLAEDTLQMYSMAASLFLLISLGHRLMLIAKFTTDPFVAAYITNVAYSSPNNHDVFHSEAWFIWTHLSSLNVV